MTGLDRLDQPGDGLDRLDQPGDRLDQPGEGLVVTHRRYVPYSHAHYAGNLVDGAYSLGLFGDVATEVCIRTDGDEGLFASYSDVQFRAPVRAGDVLEVTAEVVRMGRRSRTLELACRVVARGCPEVGESAARMLEEPIVATTATGTVVVPQGSGVSPSRHAVEE
jgi:3-aminobutyryl-CoA ammonia-lyase